MSALPRPIAPSSIASRTTRRIVSSSAGVAGPSAIPFAYARTVPAPTNEPTFTAIVMLLHLAEPRVEATRAAPVAHQRRCDVSIAWAVAEAITPSFTGAHVVTLAEDHRRDALRDHADGAAVAGEQLDIGLRLDVDHSRSDHESARIDSALGLRRARAHRRGVMRTIRSPTMPTSPYNHALPVPSTILPPVMTTSKACAHLRRPGANLSRSRRGVAARAATRR